MKISRATYLVIAFLSYYLGVALSMAVGYAPRAVAVLVLGLLVAMAWRPRLRKKLAFTMLMTGVWVWGMTFFNLNLLSWSQAAPPVDLAALEAGSSTVPSGDFRLTGPLKILYGRGVVHQLPGKPSRRYFFPVVSRHHPAFADATASQAPLTVWVLGEEAWRGRPDRELSGLVAWDGSGYFVPELKSHGAPARLVLYTHGHDFEAPSELDYQGTTSSFSLGCVLVTLGAAMFIGSFFLTG